MLVLRVLHHSCRRLSESSWWQSEGEISVLRGCRLLLLDVNSWEVLIILAERRESRDQGSRVDKMSISQVLDSGL